MAPKADLKTETKELGAAIGAARKKTVNFALLIAKNGLVFESDPRKSIDALRSTAKKKGGAKGAWGSMRCEGSKLFLTCEANPPGNLEKLAKRHFAERGQSLQIEFVQNEGETKCDSSNEAAPRVDAPDETALVTDDLDESEDETELSGAGFGVLLQKARKKPHNFVWLIGENDLVLKAHPRHATDKLRQQAKAEGGGSRGASGVLSINGKTVILTCEEEPPRSFARLAKTWMADAGHKYLVKAVAPDGGEWGGGETDQSDPAEPERSSDENAISKSSLASDLKSVAADLKRRSKSMPDYEANALKTVLKTTAGAIAKGELPAAKNALDNIALQTSLSTKSPLKTEESGHDADGQDEANRKLKAALMREFSLLQPSLKGLVKTSNSVSSRVLQRRAKEFGAEIKIGDLDRASAIIADLKTRMDEITTAHSEGARQRGLSLESIRKRAQTLEQRLDQLEAEHPQN